MALAVWVGLMAAAGAPACPRTSTGLAVLPHVKSVELTGADAVTGAAVREVVMNAADTGAEADATASP